MKRNREAIRTLLGFALVASAGAGLWGCEPPPPPVQEDDEENNNNDNNDAGNNGEEDTATNNAGACDPACGPTQTCANGVCMDVPPDPNVCNPACGPNQVCTNNICVDNAPQCNPACSPGYTCNAGVCEPDVIAECNPACEEGYTCVNGTCVSDGPGPGVDCSAYVYRGQTYDCSTLDICTERDLVFITACATCDPALLDGQANCGPVCGDGLCDSGETTQTCAGDCPPQLAQVESCMRCHNGASEANNYSGPGLSNPHPFAPQANISCTGCHGGNPNGAGKDGSHVAPPPELATDQLLINDPIAYFNFLTKAGLDNLGGRGPTGPYTGANGQTYTNLDYIQFMNPGDLRAVTAGKGCGANGCHGDQHAQWFSRNQIATETGFWSNTRFMIGVDSIFPENRNLDSDSLAEYTFRPVSNPGYNPGNRVVGETGELRQIYEYAGYYPGPNSQIRNNPANYAAANLPNHVYAAAEDPQRPFRVRANSPLEHLVMEQVTITCGDCHAGSAGANNRYADFRSSGCTTCHMQYSLDGRSRSTDPNVNKLEPVNPDAIAAPERPHIETHQIRNVAKILPNGTFIRGISDNACVGCHQGSNRTVLQYWGIRLDQNQDLVNNFQYPANPANFQNTAQDTRLFDPAVANNTFNGRNANQYILYEDYDNDNRDDTPPDIHYEAGLGCIDCHGSRDVHGGTEGDPSSGKIVSRMGQQVQIVCENCHGGIDAYAPYGECTTYDGRTSDCAQDKKGNALRNVTRDANGDWWLISRLDGQRHYIPQTKDTIIQNNKRHPITQQLLYSPKASYAMGRADGNAQTGIGPLQNNPNLVRQGFAHTDTMDCASCHAAWTNNCVGCHLANQYDVNPNNYFASNVTGERILLFQKAADFVYINPVPFILGVNSHGKITKIAPGMKMFFRHVDYQGNESAVLAFNDRLGEGFNPNSGGRNDFPSLSHNQFYSHSVRGKVTDRNEGGTYCVGCHNTVDGFANFANEYADFQAAYYNNDFANLDFNVLQQHIGQNPGNQLNSPIWVHMAAGLGSGLYLFDATGCPVNPLDNNANRQYCPDGAPAANFANQVNNVVYDLDRVVEFNGVPNANSNHPMQVNSNLRAGATNSQMSGPLGARLLQRLVDPANNQPLLLDSWLDANSNAQGGAANFVQ